ncbi:MAG: glycoside hydrolase family 97 catalytic domain-containing protein, partial [Opitutales bacterium]
RETVFGGPVRPTTTGAWTSPWRLMVIGDELGTIVESTMGTDLAAPNRLADTSWIQPGKASWSWLVLKDDSVNEETQKAFIDYAAEMGWDYTLVDVNWDRNIGYERMAALADYAADKGVGLILWYNSAGDWNSTPYTPKSRLLTAESREAEFSRLAAMGIKGVKIDFFPGDGQSVMAYYHDLFEAAARHQLTVNTHGTTLPRGWHRTYPNLVTMESVMGMEFVTFTQYNADRAARHAALLPFTRNVFDPMDYTPMVLSELPAVEKRTRKSFELALPVLFQSGVQHLGETPEGMATQPDFVPELLRDLPTAWDETRFLAGFPGESAVLARRQGNQWWVAGINALDTPHAFTLQLPGLSSKTKGRLYTGAEHHDALAQATINLQPGEPIEVEIEPRGGFVLVYSVR